MSKLLSDGKPEPKKRNKKIGEIANKLLVITDFHIVTAVKRETENNQKLNRKNKIGRRNILFNRCDQNQQISVTGMIPEESCGFSVMSFTQIGYFFGSGS